MSKLWQLQYLSQEAESCEILLIQESWMDVSRCTEAMKLSSSLRAHSFQSTMNRQCHFLTT